jgi:hypothetical protein
VRKFHPRAAQLASEFHPDAVAYYPEIYDAQMNILYAGETAQPDRKS